MTKVTVLLPVFNDEKYLDQSIDSILNQSYTDFEFLIINDGSTDSTLKILEKFSDERIKVINNPSNQGLVFSLNLGLDLAIGEFIIRMDSDDISLPERIQKQVDFMESNPEIVICGTNRFVIGKEGFGTEVQLTPSELVSISIFNSPLVHPSVCIRKSFLEKYQLKYDSNFVHAEDTALWLEIIKKGGLIHVFNERLLGYREHLDQVSFKFRNIQKKTSTNSRKAFLNDVFGIKLNYNEVQLYQAISYKEEINNITVFDSMKTIIEKFQKVCSQKKDPFDQKKINKILYSRISIVYLKSYKLGICLFFNYVNHFLFDKNIQIGAKLFTKTIFNKLI